MSNQNRRAGFTLIELLVVIAIIAILAAILFPVFAQAREKARQTSCLSNMKQMGLGLVQYVQDYDETFPMGQWYETKNYGAKQTSWVGAIDPYVKSGTKYANGGVDAKRGIYSCPSNSADFQTFHYGISLDIGVDGSSCPWVSGEMEEVTTLADIDAPADKIGVMEKGNNFGVGGWLAFATWEWDWVPYIGYNMSNGTYDQTLDGMSLASDDCDYQAVDDPSIDSYTTWAGCGMLPRFRHNGMCNVIFLDGHAKGMPRNGIKWWKNISIPSGASKRFIREGWYPW